MKQARAAGLPEPQRQVVLRDHHAVEKEGPLDRKYTFDFAWLSERLLVEIQGGGWAVRSVECKRCKFINRVRMGGAHSTGTGLNRDAEKAAIAVALGYRLLTFTTNHIEDETAIPWVRLALAAGGCSSATETA